MDVALIRWPADEDLRADLAERGHPRLLLVEPDSEPPLCADVLEDWVRLPVSPTDRNARIKALESRMGGDDRPRPTLDQHGTLEYRELRAQLPPTQAELIRPLVERFGAVVSRQTLIEAAWPEAEAPANTLDVTMSRLRRQLHSLGLRIRTVRSRGYLLTDRGPSPR